MDFHLKGYYECRQDDRGRLRLPAEIVHRHVDEGGHFVVRKGLDPDCLVLSPYAAYKIEADRVQGLDSMKPKNRKFKRMFFTSSKDVSLDGNSRIQIPPHLKEKAGIGRDVVIAGVGDYYEIWDRDKYHAQEDGYDDDEFGGLAGEIYGANAQEE